MNLEKLKQRKAHEYFMGLNPPTFANFSENDLTDAHEAGWAAAEELYRPLLEAVEEIAACGEWKTSEGFYVVRAGARDIAVSALESLRKAVE